MSNSIDINSTSNLDVETVDAVLSMSSDPLLNKNNDRFVLFPIQHHDLWEANKNAVALLWTAEVIDLSKDTHDWKKLSDAERHFFSHVLAFFAASDGIVNENLAMRFYNDVAAPEARAFYGTQIFMENIHAETYSLLLDAYVSDERERRRLQQAIETIPIVGAKARWALQWLGSENSFAERLIAFACVEGIFFSSSFCSIYWLKAMKKGLMPGLTFSNELISRDEGLHTDFACMLHNKLQDKCHPNRIVEIVTNAVKLECRFATEALPVSLIGMNADLMSQYIKFVADRLLVQLGCAPFYGVSCPFDFMANLGLQNKTNLHEKKVAEYRRAGVGMDSDASFSTNEDF